MCLVYESCDSHPGMAVSNGRGLSVGLTVAVRTAPSSFKCKEAERHHCAHCIDTYGRWMGVPAQPKVRALYSRYVKAVYRPSEISLTYTGRSSTMAGRYGPAPYAGRMALRARHAANTFRSKVLKWRTRLAASRGVCGLGSCNAQQGSASRFPLPEVPCWGMPQMPRQAPAHAARSGSSMRARLASLMLAASLA